MFIRSYKRKLNKETVVVVFRRLSLEGYLAVYLNLNDFERSPTLYHSDNINGGNPDKKLRLGNLEFDGEPDFVAKAGTVAGLTLSGNNRLTYGRQAYEYFCFPSLFTRTQPLLHKIEHTGVFKDKIRRAHIDMCASVNKQNKQISSSDETS